MRRLVTHVILAALLLTGCTKPPETPPPAPVETGASEPGAVPGQGQTLQPAGVLQGFITAAPANIFQHHQIKPGEAINRSGLFVMQTATGEVEGWSLGGDLTNIAYYGISTDNRWVSAQTQEKVYLLDRKSGAAYQWAPNNAYLVAARGDTLLYRTHSQFWIASADLERITPVALKPADWPRALFAPDGKAAVLVNEQKVHLMDVASGAIREIGSLISKREYGVTWLGTQQRGEQIIAGIDDEVQRYDWTGKKLGEQSVPGHPQFSPDGRLVAWSSNLLDIAGTMVVAAASDLAPKFRLVSIDQCGDGGPRGNPWLADSSGLVVRTGNGQGYQFLSADGTLGPLKALGGKRSRSMPVPAPDRADWFALDGVRVVDASGRPVAAAVPYSEGQWQGINNGLEPWGETSDEVRFALITWGKDYGCLPAIFPPEVQMAPFPDITGLEVTVAAGDCVNLRQSFDLTAPVVTCLPNGTKLTGSTPPGQLNKGYLTRGGSNVVVTDMGGDGWWFVRTDTGQRGWVRLSGEYLKLAEARAGAPAPDPVADLIRDEAENLLWWFSVAEGEAECGPACAGIDAWEAPVWALAEWCRQSGQGYGYGQIRRQPGFDPARHEAGVTALEGSCKSLQSAWTKLGEPVDSPSWREAVANVKASLLQYRAQK